jgi:hypothetical protein
VHFVFGDHEQEALSSCISFWESEGFRPTVRTSTHTPDAKESTRHVVNLWSVELVRWFDKVGANGAAHTKRIPAFVFTLPVELRKEFIRGLMDSDGHWADPEKVSPNLHMCQRALLQDVKLLLRTLGVESRLRGPYTNGGQVSYRLDIHNRMLCAALFNERPRMARIHAPAPRFLMEEFVRKTDGRRDYPTPSARVLRGRMAAGGHCSVYTLKYLCDAMGVTLSAPLYVPRQVISVAVSPLLADTYTLSVDDPTHRFEAEGLIHKNTGADALKLALRDVHQRLLKYDGRAKIVHHVHDEIILEVDDEPDLIEAAKVDLCAGMKGAMQQFLKRVPTVVDATEGYSWGEAKA